jgi:hypothetical protein
LDVCIAGAPAFSKEVLIDGVPATAQIQGNMGVQSKMEATREFSVSRRTGPNSLCAAVFQAAVITNASIAIRYNSGIRSAVRETRKTLPYRNSHG